MGVTRGAGWRAGSLHQHHRQADSLGVGRQNGALQGVDPNTPTPQDIVSNGLAFTRDGDLVVADTARGALWKIRLDGRGRVTSPVGCDETYTANTLCLDDVLVQHPYLDGADGIAVDAAGRIWADAKRAERGRRARLPRSRHRVLPQPGRRRLRPAQRRTAGVPDQPGLPRYEVLHDQLRRQPPGRLPQHGQAGRRHRQDLLPRPAARRTGGPLPVR